MLDVKKEGIKLLIGMAFIIGLIMVIRIFHIPLWAVFSGLLSFNIISSLIHKTFTFKGAFFSFLYLLFVFALILFIEPIWGVWSYFAVILILCIMIVYKRRKKWFAVKHHIETMIWGKPLNDFKGKPPKPF